MNSTSSTSTGDPAVVTVERRSPTAVFSLLGDDIRIDILEALSGTPGEAVPFADLRRRVGIRDSGQFNYHLGRLRGSFVRRTDEGYRLTYAGRRIVGAMHAGTYTSNATLSELSVEGGCPVCGGQVVASYAEETALVACADCGEWRNEFPFPPGSLDQYAPAELPSAFGRWGRHAIRGLVEGFCGTCAGRMDGRLVVDDPNEPATVAYECGRCGSGARASVSVPALFHPAVQGFLYEQGIDASRQPLWRLEDVVRPDVTVESTEPSRATVRFAGETESLAVTLGPDGQVQGVERLRDDG